MAITKAVLAQQVAELQKTVDDLTAKLAAAQSVTPAVKAPKPSNWGPNGYRAVRTISRGNRSAT